MGTPPPVYRVLGGEVPDDMGTAPAAEAGPFQNHDAAIEEFERRRRTRDRPWKRLERWDFERGEWVTEAE